MWEADVLLGSRHALVADVGGEGRVYVAFDATGRESWRAHVSGDREGITVALAGEAAVLAHRSFGDLVALDPIDGSEPWRLPLPGTSPSFSVLDQAGGTLALVTDQGELVWLDLGALSVAKSQVGVAAASSGGSPAVSLVGDLVVLDAGGRLLAYEVVR